MRILGKAATALVVLLLSAGCTSSNPSAKPTAVKATTTQVSPSSGSTTADPWDGKDPNATGCSLNAKDVPRSAVPVYLADGKTRYGTLLIRESPACNTMWARVQGITKPGVDLKLSLARGALSTGYSTNRAAPNIAAFSSMLSVIGTQCIYAQATAGGGPMAKTGCVHG